jgi:flavorubredoxin
MPKVLIVYTTRSGHTKEIADLIAEGARMAGAEARTVDVADIKKEADLEDCDALALGSPTYHGEMMQAMKTLLFLGQKADLAGRPGGAFGSYGWSGEALDRIFDTMKNLYKMDMMTDPLYLKDPALGGGMKMAQDYGRALAKKAIEKCEAAGANN